VDLQQARQDADYNLAKSFTKSKAIALVQQADAAFQDWRTIRKHDFARIYLGSFLLWERWSKPR